MSTLQQYADARAAIVASLYIQALRQGQGLWFRVASASMNPTLRVGEAVWIEPATADEILPGEIIAFEAPTGLTTHRVLLRQRSDNALLLLQTGDASIEAGWISAQAVVGRVARIRARTGLVDLRCPLARRSGNMTARLRYLSYRTRKLPFLGSSVRKCSRLSIRFGDQCIRSRHTVFTTHDPVYGVD
ncbi:MAG: S24/S26 family peptidase [Chloroflexota bacterium]|nr:S24/S26 family peptidase [Chloroflexota bacterium]